MRLLLIALCAFIPAILADAPAGADTLQELIKEGNDRMEKALSELKKNLGLSENPNGEELVKLMKTKNDQLGEEIKKWRAKVEEQIKANPDANSILKNVEQKMKEAQEKLKKENPEIAKNAEKLAESFKSTWEGITTEIEKSHKEFTKKGGKQEEMENFLKGLIDQGTKAAKDFKDNIDKVINKKA